jgi:hypothetical protein
MTVIFRLEGVQKMPPLMLLGTRFKEEIALVNLVPRSLSVSSNNNQVWPMLCFHLTLRIEVFEKIQKMHYPLENG